MKRTSTFLALACMLSISCTKKENTGEPHQSADAPAAAQPSGGPHAFVRLKNGTKVPGSIVASSQTDIVLAGDDGIERKIPLTQVASVDYGEAQPMLSARQASRETAPPKRVVQRETPPEPQAPPQAAPQMPPPTPALPPPPAVTTKTYELPPGREVSVRTNELFDSATAAEGQTFDAQVTREVKDA